MVAAVIFLSALLLAPAAAEGANIRDYSSIALVRVAAAKPSEWKPGPRQTKVRMVELELAVERTLKGAAPRNPRIKLKTEQAEPGPRDIAVPGAWSRKSIEPGTRYVLFSKSDLAKSDRVEDAGALPQVELALEADTQKWPLGELGAKASKEALGPISGEYVLGRLGEVLYSDAAQFDALLSWLESPETPTNFRLQLASGIFPKVISADPVPQPFSSRLAVAGFRMAALPNAGPLRESILSTYLPNLLGLNGGISRKTPEQVFGAFPGEREKARPVARSSPALSQWIGAN